MVLFSHALGFGDSSVPKGVLTVVAIFANDRRSFYDLGS